MKHGSFSQYQLAPFIERVFLLGHGDRIHEPFCVKPLHVFISELMLFQLGFIIL